ncbi:hypothetical protein [Flavobacterium sp. MDT1-60]|uniref:hypothetical protein n=1 Tax=Flavobacterium sp. MDT1-60 TaxID=1979344 RepID=UPI00177B83D8|nr:hypothetical protein [Flavobacterium sp. MDT1-60]QOG03782.1 hypothetical protein IHE43_06020 [Flavobacterium sp. MDT1-60]
MRFNKVIYIRYMPLTTKIYADFYMQEVTDAGIEVEYWDITAIFFKNNYNIEDSSKLVNTRIFRSYSELESALNSEPFLSKVLFVSIMSFEGRIRKLYEILTKYNCILSVFGRNMFPLPVPPKTFFGVLNRVKISTVLNYIRFKKVLKSIRKGKIKRYDIVFIGGDLGWQGIGRVGLDDIKNAEQVKVNSDDYDNYLLLKDRKNTLSDKYILFLDEYLPLHPDTVLFNIKNVKAEDYYPELNSYFDRVEKQFGLPVVIAAHPKAIRYKTEDFFSGRKVIFKQTAELTKYAQFVIAHDSTSINYPIAFGKKLHFITSKNIMNGIEEVHRNVIHFANYLGCNYQFMNNEEGINLIEELPLENYQKYKYSFQTSSDTENKLTRDIFIDFLIKE